MKKFSLLLLVLLMGFGLVACKSTVKPPVEENPNEELPDIEDPDTKDPDTEDPDDEEPVIVLPDPIDYLDIFYVNDLHGALEQDMSQSRMGVASIASLVTHAKNANPENTLILAGGDMLQGSALSNHSRGKATLDILEAMKFDAFVLGNHEFDWGLEEVTKHFVNDTYSYPMLAANVFYKGTQTIPAGLTPYTVIQKGDMKIGIIGTMGYGLESSIAPARVADYEFVYPVDIVKQYASHLRQEEGVDLVLWLSHDPGDLNYSIAGLTGDEKIDAIFNAHSHQAYARSNLGIPEIQSGGYGNRVGHVRFQISNKAVTSFTVANLGYNDHARLQLEDATIKGMVQNIKAELDLIYGQTIIYNPSYLDRGQLTTWMAKLIKDYMGADVGIHNYGGTRVALSSGNVNLYHLAEIWTFDNTIKMAELKGSEVQNLIYRFGLNEVHTNISYFEPNTYYKVATNDFIFDQPTNPFLSGRNPIETLVNIRDLAEKELALHKSMQLNMSVNHPILSRYSGSPGTLSFYQYMYVRSAV